MFIVHASSKGLNKEEANFVSFSERNCVLFVKGAS